MTAWQWTFVLHWNVDGTVFFLCHVKLYSHALLKGIWMANGDGHLVVSTSQSNVLVSQPIWGRQTTFEGTNSPPWLLGCCINTRLGSQPGELKEWTSQVYYSTTSSGSFDELPTCENLYRTISSTARLHSLCCLIVSQNKFWLPSVCLGSHESHYLGIVNIMETKKVHIMPAKASLLVE